MRFVDVSRIRSRFDEPIVAGDGVRLSADVYRPPQPGRYPTLITRTPYDNNRSTFPTDPPALPPAPADRFKRLAAHGFIVVACDVRGKGDSDGRFLAFAHEADDGRATVDWARGLPDSDGRVGLFGSGYAGFTALAAASATDVDAVAAWSPFDPADVPFHGGALRLDWLFWMHLTGGRTPQPVDVPQWKDIFRHRPLATMHEALGREDAAWPTWLDGHELPTFEPRSTAPTLLVTGWWDGGLSATLRRWHAADGAPHRLIVGPWDTEAVRDPRADTGGIAWGPTAVLDPEELLVDWFSEHLGSAASSSGGARVFMTGRNEWTSLDPTAEPSATASWWLASGGAANTRRGNGRLVAASEDTPADRFTHDPDHPVPWQPGGGSFSRHARATLTLDTSFATSRDDVLVYDAPPVSAPVRICGRPSVELWVHTTAADADWVVAIEDVFPGAARSVHLAHGIVRTGTAEPAVQLTIELTAVTHELLPGHSLRLLVSSSMWPLYAVNLGGGDYLHDTTARISEQTVFHERAFPSRLRLPLVERVDR